MLNLPVCRVSFFINHKIAHIDRPGFRVVFGVNDPRIPVLRPESRGGKALLA